MFWISFCLSFAKSLRRHHKDFFPLDVSTSVLDGGLVRLPGERCSQEKCERCLVRVSRRRAYTPRHSDGAARRVSEKIESCCQLQGENVVLVDEMGFESASYMETKEFCGAPRPSKSLKGTQWNP
jgi:hypothetical protein